MSMKNPLTPAGIEPATFQFVAQYLNRCVPDIIQHRTIISIRGGKGVRGNEISFYTKSVVVCADGKEPYT